MFTEKALREDEVLFNRSGPFVNRVAAVRPRLLPTRRPNSLETAEVLTVGSVGTLYTRPTDRSVRHTVNSRTLRTVPEPAPMLAPNKVGHYRYATKLRVGQLHGTVVQSSRPLPKVGALFENWGRLGVEDGLSWGEFGPLADISRGRALKVPRAERRPYKQKRMRPIRIFRTPSPVFVHKTLLKPRPPFSAKALGVLSGTLAAGLNPESSGAGHKIEKVSPGTQQVRVAELWARSHPHPAPATPFQGTLEVRPAKYRGGGVARIKKETYAREVLYGDNLYPHLLKSSAGRKRTALGFSPLRLELRYGTGKLEQSELAFRKQALLAGHALTTPGYPPMP